MSGHKQRKLIVLMGLDGSGKSTQSALLARMFKDRGVKAAVVWMRGGAYVTRPLLKITKTLMGAPKAVKRGGSEEVSAHKQYVAKKRSLFRNPLARSAWRNLALTDFYIAYKRAFSKIPKDTSVVILDRYIYDRMVDIDIAFDSKGAEIRRLLSSAAGRVPRPDRVVLIDIPPAEAMRRKDDIPSMAYLEERTVPYRVAAERLGAVVIDGTRPIEAVRKAIADAVRDLLPAPGQRPRAAGASADTGDRRDRRGPREDRAAGGARRGRRGGRSGRRRDGRAGRDGRRQGEHRDQHEGRQPAERSAGEGHPGESRPPHDGGQAEQRQAGRRHPDQRRPDESRPQPDGRHPAEGQPHEEQRSGGRRRRRRGGRRHRGSRGRRDQRGPGGGAAGGAPGGAGGGPAAGGAGSGAGSGAGPGEGAAL